jgi:hypothetical protein
MYKQWVVGCYCCNIQQLRSVFFDILSETFRPDCLLPLKKTLYQEEKGNSPILNFIKIISAVIELFDVDRRSDMAKLVYTLYQLFSEKAPKTHIKK